MADNKSQQDKPVSPEARASALLRTLGSGIRTGNDSDARKELISLCRLISDQQKQITDLERRIASLERGAGTD